MMFSQSLNRNQRTKGSKIKTVVQVSLLLAITIWLLYQIRHTYDKKADFSAIPDDKPSNGDGDLHLGRKGKAGSENVIIIDAQEVNTDELSEIKEDGGGQADPGDWPSEEKGGAETINKEHEDSQEEQQEKLVSDDVRDEATDKDVTEEKESQEDITDGNNNGNQQQQQDDEIANADTDVNHENEAAEKSLIEGRDDVLQLPSQRESEGNDVSGDQEKNEFANDGHIDQDSTIDGAKSDDGEIVTDQATTSEATDGGENGENANTPLPEEQTNAETSMNDEVHDKETLESRQGNSDTETNGNSEAEGSRTNVKSADELVDISVTSEQNSVSTDNENLAKDELEQQNGSTGNTEITEHHTTETIDANTKADDSDESHEDNASVNSSEKDKSDMGSGDDLVKLSLPDEQNNLHTDNGRSDADISASNVLEEGNANPKFSEVQTNLSLTNEVDGADITTKVEDTKEEDAKVEETETQVGGASGDMNADVANSFQGDKDINSQIMNEKTSGEETVQSHGAVAENTSNDTVKDEEAVSNSNVETITESTEGDANSDSSTSAEVFKQERTDPISAQ